MHKLGSCRTQYQLCYSLENEIEADNEVRVIDAFVDALDMEKCKFLRAIPSKEGRPGYNPRDLLKLYIYGNMNGVRSSRKLEKECRRNIEVKWLLCELKPDFRTISDFRKNNAEPIKTAFHEFNQFIRGKGNPELYSVDGSKFRASNARSKIFTANELDANIARLTIKLEDYLKQLDANDQADDDSADEAPSIHSLTQEEIEEKIVKTRERLEEYRSYLKILLESNQTQISLTDPDARVMRTSKSYVVGYNVQTAVSDEHSIEDFLVSNSSTDHGLMLPSMKNIREETKGAILNVTGDKGYEKPSDMIACLMDGIIPNVIPPTGKNSYTLEIEYEQAEISEEMRKSTQPEDIAKMLKSGVIPDALKDVLSDIQVKEKIETFIEESDYDSKMSLPEYIAKASEGYFLRDIEEDKVICPAGQILRRVAAMADGSVRYCNKKACEKCPYRNRCTNAKYKKVSFKPNQASVFATRWNKQNKDNHGQKRSKSKKTRSKTIVTVVFRPNKEHMGKRKELSEHPFGTLKRSLNGSYFLTRGQKHVEAEVAMLCLAYNIRHAINRIGVPELLRKIRALARALILFFISLILSNLIRVQKVFQASFHKKGEFVLANPPKFCQPSRFQNWSVELFRTASNGILA